MNNPTIISKSKMMYHVAQGHMRESFEHEELGLFDVTIMRFHAAAKGERVSILLSQVLPFVEENRVIEPQRVLDLDTNSWMNDPILYVRIYDGFPFGVSYLLIDGAHRVKRRALEHCDYVDAIIVDQSDIVRPDTSNWGSTTDVLGLDWGAPLASLKGGK